MEPSENTPQIITLARDPQAGLVTVLPGIDADILISVLEDAGVPFLIAKPDSPQYAGPGHVCLIFGSEHPLALQQVLKAWDFEVVLGPGSLLPEHTYAPPLDRLLTLGQPPHGTIDINCDELGLRGEHTRELIRLALDSSLHFAPSDSLAVWAPVYAWRALAALKATEAAWPLTVLLPRMDSGEGDEYIGIELPKVFAALGGVALEPLTSFLADENQGEWSRSTAADALEKIAQRHPALRDDCIKRITSQLGSFANHSETLNASLIWNLAQLKALESMPVIQAAFAAGKVDEAHCGDLDDIEIEMGLKKVRERPRKPNRLTELGAKLRALGEAKREPAMPYLAPPKPGRNEPCPCGSGRKYKKCCGR